MRCTPAIKELIVERMVVQRVCVRVCVYVPNIDEDDSMYNDAQPVLILIVRSINMFATLIAVIRVCCRHF